MIEIRSQQRLQLHVGKPSKLRVTGSNPVGLTIVFLVILRFVAFLHSRRIALKALKFASDGRKCVTNRTHSEALCF